MTDEQSDGQSADDASPQVENPALAYVKGGTGTARSEKLYEERYQDAEARRQEADAMKQLSADQQKVEDPEDPDAEIYMPGRVGGAVQYTSQMTAHPEVSKAYICLTYLTPTGSEWKVNGEVVRCRADLIPGADPERPTELCLILVCPKCEQDTHKHSQDNQLRIFQSNRHFEFVAGKGPPTFLFKEWDRVLGMFVEKLYHSAGMIVESERFECPDCGWRARIDHNHVRPD